MASNGKILIQDISQVTALDSAEPTPVFSAGADSVDFVVDFKKTTGDPIASLRTQGLTGAGVITLYYEAPNGSYAPSKDYNTGTTITLTASKPEIGIFGPGTYRAVVTTASATAGQLFVDGLF